MSNVLRTMVTAMVISVLSGMAIFSQIPRTISYQGVLLDQSGAFIPDGNHVLKLNLYDNQANPPIYTETQTVPVVKGVFNVIIGSTTPIPTTVKFDRGYFLGVEVDAGAELAPRTPMTAVPYALNAAHADVADALSPTATGVVKSVNGQSGALTFTGTGGTTVTTNGSAITINSTSGSGGGVNEVKTTDGSILVLNGQGPSVTTNVADGGITTNKIADNAVTTAKIVDGSIISSKIASGIIPTTLPPNGPASGDLTGTYPSPTIRTDAVTTGKILNAAVTNAKLADNAVTTTKIVDGSVTLQKLADNSVTSQKIVDGTIQLVDLAAGVLPTTLPPSGAAGGDLTGTYPSPQINPNAVTSTKILDGTIQDIDIANGAIKSAQIQDATIQAADIAPGVIPTTLPPTGPAGGDLTGTYPAPVIAPGAVTGTKISTVGAATNQSLTFNGSAVVWAFPAANSLVMPFSQTANIAFPMFSLTQQGTAQVGVFTINNPANNSNTFESVTNGSGNGIYGAHTAATGTAAGIRGETSSQDANAVGVQGLVNPTAPGGFSAGVRGINNGTGGLGIGVYGTQAGSGWGVYGTTPSGIGVHGNSTNGFGMYALSTNGTALYGNSTNGISLNAEITNSASSADVARFNQVGSGRGVYSTIANTANSNAAVRGETNGSGFGIQGVATGSSGNAASFQNSNASNTSNAVSVTHSGIGNGISVSLPNASNGARGIDVTQSGVGPGVFATSAGGNAVWGITSSISAAGVIGDNTFGEAVVGRNRGGNGVGAVVGRNDSSGYGVRGFNTKNGYGVLGQAGISGGTGVGGRFENVNAANTSNTAEVSTNGIGNGISISLTNASNGGRGVDVNQAGVGPGVFATSAGGNAVWGITSSISAAGVIGDNTFGEAVVGRNRGGNGVGAVVGRNDSSGYGVRGFNTKDGIGVLGQSGISGGTGVAGRFENVNAANTNTTVTVATNGIGNGISVSLPNASNGARGIDVTQSGVGPGVFATSAGGNAVWGITSSISAAGVIGDNTFGEAVVGRNRGGNGVGAVVGRNDSSGYGVRGFNTKDGIGVLGQSGISGGTGVAGRFENVNAANTSDALQVVTNSAGNAARFTGNVVVNGNLTVSGTVAKGGGTFMIDHPLDPLNKIMYHSFVESPDMKNINDGVVTLDEKGEAVVTMPDWFEALNQDFRYQLTAIGAQAPGLYVSEEIKNNQFKIAGGKPGMKVSWQVTGIRHDAYAKKHPVQVEVEKNAAQRGQYIHPDAYGVQVNAADNATMPATTNSPSNQPTNPGK